MSTMGRGGVSAIGEKGGDEHHGEGRGGLNTTGRGGDEHHRGEGGGV